ncbi:hypothetical protein QCA50_010375 [Cerrena zonata]|uniref:Phosphatidic acid phosphatase type 2/haloperoxidase domain-containing protein n=1 Tax=Cerrena zonata TaxID=2478898 RepID=A0AAW0GAP3_9APHY
MSAMLTFFRDRISHTFGPHSFDWFSRAYLVDWLVSSLAWFIAWIIKELPPFEREFSLDDPLINHGHRKNQISGSLTWMIALIVPLVFVFSFGLFKLSAIEVHHGALGLYTARAFTALVTEVLKNRVGRLRPDFLVRCKWKEELQACSGSLDKVLDGRRSFPSGHSSTAFSGMTFLSLWLAGVTCAWCFSEAMPSRSLLSSRIARTCLTLFPMAFATWVAVSRVEDYRHHKEDVIVGSLIGIDTATAAYLVYFPNPFLSSKSPNASSTDTNRPRHVYRDEHEISRNSYDYELAGVGHATESV